MMHFCTTVSLQHFVRMTFSRHDATHVIVIQKFLAGAGKGQWACSSSGNWTKIHLNWSTGYLLIEIKTICVEAICPLGRAVR